MKHLKIIIFSISILFILILADPGDHHDEDLVLLERPLPEEGEWGLYPHGDAEEHGILHNGVWYHRGIERECIRPTVHSVPIPELLAHLTRDYCEEWGEYPPNPREIDWKEYYDDKVKDKGAWRRCTFMNVFTVGDHLERHCVQWGDFL